jgi:hypothetical protein
MEKKLIAGKSTQRRGQQNAPEIEQALLHENSSNQQDRFPFQNGADHNGRITVLGQ